MCLRSKTIITYGYLHVGSTPPIRKYIFLQPLDAHPFVNISFYSRLTRRRKLNIACGDLFTKITGALIPLRLLFRKRSRCSKSLSKKVALRLRCSLVNALATLRLATNLFQGCKSFKSLRQNAENIFFMRLIHRPEGPRLY
mgnify:CR=1 FL=1